jgi:hypothetical protein
LFSDLPVTIANFPERDADFDFIKICENDNPDCCQAHEFEGLNCEMSSLDFNDLENVKVIQLGQLIKIENLEGNYEVKLLNILGQNLMNTRIPEMDLSGKNVLSGVYFIYISKENQNITKKIFIN